MKYVKTYSNTPLINPEHGELPSVRMDTFKNIRTLLPIMDCDEFAPELVLQITPKGEIRGVIDEPTDRENYLYVCGEIDDIDFLEVFAERHPGVAPMLSDLILHRRFKVAQLRLNLIGAKY
ncbi:hypothetical protein BOO88_25930 [Stutzerimonas stutzeri]|nr:hypothetical protein BOO89_20740 [Stutzerimonas stutzeri]AZO92175.1 hypothetical protein BOO88_25930 [Stutzerimonas stutzeri]